MSDRMVYLDAPLLGEREKEYLCKAIDIGYVSSVGPFVPEFEKKLAKYLGVENSVAVQSGTAALHLSLYELGIGKGDEVIVPALTFVATVNPIVYVGAKPIFVDVDIKTWNINPEEIEKKITEKTKAIIPVHLYGNPCNMDEILNIAKKYELYVIEDATESLGAKYSGKFTGTFGDFGCFSFNGNKIITTGGGGLVVGKNKKRLEHIRFLANQARDISHNYYHPEIGFNYRMTNIEAALGLAQFERLEDFIEKKKLFNSIYREELGKLKHVSFQEECKKGESCWWLTAITIEGIDISELQKRLLKEGIQTRRIFTPVVEFPMYKMKKENYESSYKIFESGICLPSSPLNSKDDILRSCKILKGLI
ncbi:LegC family aminotransferase [Desulfurobacterium crinifex]